MGAFNGLTFTSVGLALQAKAEAGAALNFTRMAVGDGDLGTNVVADLTALINETLSLDITKLKAMSGGKAVIGTVLDNEEIVTGFYMKELGLFATDPDLGEILYCYGNAGALAEYIPAGGGPDIVEKSIDIIAIIGNATTVSATIAESLVFVTLADFEAHDHDPRYALLGHGHVIYAQANHTHSQYSLIGHTHDYAPTEHNHNQYALTTHTHVYRIPHTYAIPGEIKVPIADADFIMPFFVSLLTGQTAKLVKARYRINSGTSVTAKLQKNGVDIAGFTGMSITPAAAETDPADVTLADNDMLQLVVTAVSGTPKNLTFTIFIEYEQ